MKIVLSAVTVATASAALSSLSTLALAGNMKGGGIMNGGPRLNSMSAMMFLDDDDKTLNEQIPEMLLMSGSRSPLLPLMLNDPEMFDNESDDLLPMLMNSGAFTGYPGSTGATARLLPFMTGDYNDEDNRNKNRMAVAMAINEPTSGGGGFSPWAFAKRDSDAEGRDLLKYNALRNTEFGRSNPMAALRFTQEDDLDDSDDDFMTLTMMRERGELSEEALLPYYLTSDRNNNNNMAAVAMFGGGMFNNRNRIPARASASNVATTGATTGTRMRSGMYGGVRNTVGANTGMRMRGNGMRTNGLNAALPFILANEDDSDDLLTYTALSASGNPGAALPMFLNSDKNKDSKNRNLPIALAMAGSRSPILPALMNNPDMLESDDMMPALMAAGAFSGYPGSTGATARMLPLFAGGNFKGNNGLMEGMMLADAMSTPARTMNRGTNMYRGGANTGLRTRTSGLSGANTFRGTAMNNNFNQFPRRLPPTTATATTGPN